jgi:SAM-dependent methyltransferase
VSYQISLADYRWLRSTEGRDALARLAGAEISERNALAQLSRLRQELNKEQAAAVLEMAELRQKARTKFARADEMCFIREALEQSSAEIVSRHRARRFAGCRRVADLGCGIGGDSLSLAQVAEVLAIERDELRLNMARDNMAAYGSTHGFMPVCADWRTLLPLPVDAYYLDPSRRSGEERIFSIYRYDPPLTVLKQLAQMAPRVAAKISPGVRYDELASLGLECEIEIISERGECKEAVLWCGDLRSCARRATLLPSGATLTSEGADATIPVTLPSRYFYEPDGAVIRAHLVEPLAQSLGLTKIHADIAYLTGDRLLQTPFAKAYRVCEAQPFNLKTLKRRLRELDIGELVIKKRGFPIEPEVLRKELKLDGSQKRVLFLTRITDHPYMLICEYPDDAQPE